MDKYQLWVLANPDNTVLALGTAVTNTITLSQDDYSVMNGLGFDLTDGYYIRSLRAHGGVAQGPPDIFQESVRGRESNRQVMLFNWINNEGITGKPTYFSVGDTVNGVTIELTDVPLIESWGFTFNPDTNEFSYTFSEATTTTSGTGTDFSGSTI